jgi:membrane peptidoglycan carboxypeptidase
MYGGADYQVRQFNDATMSIPPMGSTFKTFVLAAALSQGKTLSTTYDGASPLTVGQQVYRNDSGEQFGSIDLVTATAHSVNTAFVQLGLDVGVNKVIKAAHAAGLPESTKLSPNASMLLGSDSAHPIDEAAAYATFAAGGIYAAPHFVERVTSASGKVLYSAKPTTRKAFSPEVSTDVTYALEQVLTSGTGKAAAIGHPAAGKTGTTSGNVSAWFVGYTPQLSTAVTMFRDKNAPLQGIAGYSQIYGGTLPAKIWGAFMTSALVGQPASAFPEPVTLASATPTPTPSPSPTLTESPSPTPSETPTEKPHPTPSSKPSKPGKPGKPGHTPPPKQSPSVSPSPTPSPTSGPSSGPPGHRRSQSPAPSGSTQ